MATTATHNSSRASDESGELLEQHLHDTAELGSNTTGDYPPDERQANAADSRLIRKGVWVRRRKDGSSPQFGTAAARTAARRQRSRYRHWL